MPTAPEADCGAIREEVLRGWGDEVLEVMGKDERARDVYTAILEGRGEEALDIVEVMQEEAIEIVARKHPVEFARYVK